MKHSYSYLFYYMPLLMPFIFKGFRICENHAKLACKNHAGKMFIILILISYLTKFTTVKILNLPVQKIDSTYCLFRTYSKTNSKP